MTHSRLEEPAHAKKHDAGKFNQWQTIEGGIMRRRPTTTRQRPRRGAAGPGDMSCPRTASASDEMTATNRCNHTTAPTV